MSNVEFAREFALKLNEQARTYPRVIGRLMNDLTDTGHEKVREFTPVRTGKLRDGWQKTKRSDDDIATPREITNDVEYGVFVEFGTRRMAPRRFTFRTVQYLGTVIGEHLTRALRAYGFKS